MNPNAILELRLFYFRNHFAYQWKGSAAPVILTGHNGVGKTNILEAISFLAPGRGLRSAKLAEIDQWGEEEKWAIYALAKTPQGEVNIGTGRGENTGGDKRIIKVEGQVLKTASQLKNHIGILALTPLNDRVFVDGSTARRDLLDHLVAGFDNAHSKRISAYDTARSERLKLLSTYGGYDRVWATALEARMAGSAVAIAAARLEVIQRITDALESHIESPFPRPLLGVDGTVENDLTSLPALQAEEAYCARLEQSRQADRESGRTQEGPHRSDFLVIHSTKKMPAEMCSTGEQKSLLLSLILATARARASWQGSAPILLFDEIIAHLDEVRRAALAAEIKSLGAQVWMTGTEVESFRDFLPFSQHIEVSPPVSPVISREAMGRLERNRIETSE